MNQYPLVWLPQTGYFPILKGLLKSVIKYLFVLQNQDLIIHLIKQSENLMVLIIKYYLMLGIGIMVS